MKVNPKDSIPKPGETRSDVWQQWYKELLDYGGQKWANHYFVKAWMLRGTSSANTMALRSLLNENGVQIDESLFDNVVDAGGGVLNFFGGVMNVGKYTGIALVVIIVGGIGMVVFNLARKPTESAASIIKLTAGSRLPIAA